MTQWKERVLISCEICHRQFKTEQALSGHKRFKHGTAEQGTQHTDESTQSATDDGLSRLNSDTQRVLEQQLDILRSVDDSVEQLLNKEVSDQSGQITIDTETLANQLAQQLDRRLSARHPAGLCDDDGCRLCQKQREAITWQALEKIEERVPGTRDAVAQWQLMNTPIEVTATEEELLALDALP